MFIIAVILIAASGFFLLRAVTSRRLQVESTLGRIPGYGYGEPIRTNDPRAWLRRSLASEPRWPRRSPLQPK